jgi:two-component system chemotaxis response regulator CheB
MNSCRWEAVVIGCSAGGLEVLCKILPELPADFPWSVVVVSHTTADSTGLLAEVLRGCCRLPVADARDKAEVLHSAIHVAPAGYHLLIEKNKRFALTVDAKVCNSRPSIDVLFESAAEAFADRLVGVLLTGANEDGCRGMMAIKAEGGVTIAQCPATAFVDTMPQSAIKAGAVDHVLAPTAILGHLLRLAGGG